ncbi:hypothetical protein FACS189454_04770 [Planctomycetales bacterium]|nr:hypothetical protein FACS189454_04770 [Planctomycetales bacterium]
MPFAGCAVDNEHLAKLPLFEAKSDTIPGLDPPYVRKKLIRTKGEKGAKASDSEKEVLSAQLMNEYQTSPDPNMRRESVDALAKIPCPSRDRYIAEILKDEEPFVRLSALEALDKTYSGDNAELVSILIDRLKADPDKDVRLAAIRILGKKVNTKENDALKEQVIGELGDALYDKVSAVRYESMQSLHRITGKDYGNDINRWMQYIKYQKGEVADLPGERSFTEKIPKIDLPMFK